MNSIHYNKQKGNGRQNEKSNQVFQKLFKGNHFFNQHAHYFQVNIIAILKIFDVFFKLELYVCHCWRLNLVE